MKLGLQIPGFNWPDGKDGIRRHLSEIAQAAEEAGFSSLWVMDHFFQIEMVGPVSDPMLESYSTLSYLAGITRRVKLGALVTGVVYRHPAILVKTVSTLDVLSGGRAYFGIGAAWYEREARGLGVPFPPSWTERFERLEETLQIARQMWSGQIASYQGKHYQLAETLNSPQPVTQPHPPVLVGGMGEKKTLRLAAKYADACNLVYQGDISAIRSKLEVLKRHCEAEGRDYDEIERTVLTGVRLGPDAMQPGQVVDLCRTLAQAGIQHLIVNLPDVHEIRPLEIFGREIIPAVS